MRPSSRAISREIVREVIGDIGILKRRGVLALLGIAIGTAAVIGMLHVGHNARAAALHQFEDLGTDLVMMNPQPTEGAMPRIPVELVLALPAQGVGISEAAALIRLGGSLPSGLGQTTILAATDAVYSLGGARLAEGRFTSELDRYAPFAVLGKAVAAMISDARGKPVAIGDKLTVGGQVITVVGILADSPSNMILSLELNQSIIVPFAAARRFTGSPEVNSILGRMVVGADQEQTPSEVTAYFNERLKTGTVDVQTASQLIAGIEEQMRIYALLLLCIGTVSLLVGGVGIMNVMLMSVMERRQEIGLRQALGARQRDIRLMFLCETVVLSLVGSTIGTAGGYLVGMIFAWGSGWQFEPAPLALPLGVGMALVVGLFFGIYPASNAARLDPVAALRSE